MSLSSLLRHMHSYASYISPMQKIKETLNFLYLEFSKIKKHVVYFTPFKFNKNNFIWKITSECDQKDFELLCCSYYKDRHIICIQTVVVSWKYKRAAFTTLMWRRRHKIKHRRKTPNKNKTKISSILFSLIFLVKKKKMFSLLLTYTVDLSYPK